MKDLDRQILEDVEPVLEGMGYFAVEIRTVIQKSGPRVYVVITKQGGVNIDDTAEVLQILRPRIQLLLETQDVYLEVSSPGIDRVLKSPREFRAFIGRGVKVLREGQKEWVGGVIDSVKEDLLHLRKDERDIPIPFEQIKKAKLDYTEEVHGSYGV
ncbi:MAG: ribosome maturation factor RimP [Spirochaetes bacterium]|nr:ribosome maturation factor RimP [Spirochaetota bacterium]